ncbi:MAG: thiamine biosynthesis lipoprotein [Lysobacterales bacterium]
MAERVVFLIVGKKIIGLIYRFRFAIIAITVALSLWLRPQVADINVKYNEARMLMGTTVSIDVCQSYYDLENIIQVYAEVWERLEEIAWRMNVYDARSEVTLINNAQGATVTIQEDTYQLLKRSKYAYQQTHQTFDITVRPLIDFWKEKSDEGVMPSEEELQEILPFIGAENIRLLKNNQVQLNNPHTRIDLGGNAKGYAIDEAVRIFKKHDIERVFVDAGGDVFVSGASCQNTDWRVGVRDSKELNRIALVVKGQNIAVTTSGNYEQYVVIGDKKFSHIIDPRTGMPQENVASATVIGPSAEVADVLSTALTVLDPEEGVALIDRLGEGYASLTVVMNAQAEVLRYESKNLKSYLVQINNLKE